MAASPHLTGIKGGLAMSDGLVNVMTGAGTGVDRAAYNRYSRIAPISPAEVDDAYRTSWLVRKVHDLPPLDMTREWRDWQTDKASIEKLEAEERRLGLIAKVQTALLWARIYGGAAIILGVGDANPASPLPANLGNGGLKYVNVVSRYGLNFDGDLDLNPVSELYGEPLMWSLGNGQVRIHPSRVVTFIGQPIPRGLQGPSTANYWGDPLLESIRDATVNAESVQQGIAALIQEAKIDVIGIPELMAQVGTAEYEARLLRRLALAQSGKSNHNALIKDTNETWEQKQLTFATLPEVAKLFLMIASGASDIPMTRLLGKSADGMNATGEGDDKNYDRMIGTKQERELMPQLHRIDELLIPSALGSRPADLYWTFAPLDEPTEKDRAAIAKTKAETTKIYVDTGLVPDAALSKATQNQLVEDGQYPGLDAALEEAEKAGEVPSILEEPDPSALQAIDPATGKPVVAAPVVKPPPPMRKAANDARFNDATPRTLYVRRNLVNGAEFIRWAKAQGFATTTPAADLHVTIAFSRQKVDWMKVGENWSGDKDGRIIVPPGGARIVEKLGDKGAVVLLFSSSELAWRHEVIKRDAGASWDFDSYQPHVTITYEGGDLDLSKVEPYRGKLVFGPEVFEEVVEDWEKGLKET